MSFRNKQTLSASSSSLYETRPHGVNLWSASLMNPEIQAGIPDDNIERSVLESSVISDVVPLNDSEVMFVQYPQDPQSTVREYRRTTAPSAQWGLYQLHEPSAPIFEDFDRARKTSGYMRLTANSASQDGRTFQGWVTAANYQTPPDLLTLTPANITAADAGKGSELLLTRLADGFVGLMPPGDQHVYVVGTSNATWETQNVVTRTTFPGELGWTVGNFLTFVPVIYDSGLSSDFVLPNLFGRVTFDAAVSCVLVDPAPVAATLMTLTLHVSRQSADALGNLTTSLSQHTLDVRPTLAAASQVCAARGTVALTAPQEITRIVLTWDNAGVAGQTATLVGPGCSFSYSSSELLEVGLRRPANVAIVTGTVVGQQLVLTGRSNYQAIPNSNLARRLKPTGYGMPNPGDLYYAAAIFSSGVVPVIWNARLYDDFLAGNFRIESDVGTLTFDTITSRDFQETLSLGAFDYLMEAGRGLAPLLPAAGRAIGAPLGPTGAKLGAIAGGALRDLVLSRGSAPARATWSAGSTNGSGTAGFSYDRECYPVGDVTYSFGSFSANERTPTQFTIDVGNAVQVDPRLLTGIDDLGVPLLEDDSDDEWLALMAAEQAEIDLTMESAAAFEAAYTPEVDKLVASEFPALYERRNYYRDMAHLFGHMMEEPAPWLDDSDRPGPTLSMGWTGPPPRTDKGSSKVVAPAPDDNAEAVRPPAVEGWVCVGPNQYVCPTGQEGALPAPDSTLSWGLHEALPLSTSPADVLAWERDQFHEIMALGYTKLTQEEVDQALMRFTNRPTLESLMQQIEFVPAMGDPPNLQQLSSASAMRSGSLNTEGGLGYCVFPTIFPEDLETEEIYERPVRRVVVTDTPIGGASWVLGYTGWSHPMFETTFVTNNLDPAALWACLMARFCTNDRTTRAYHYPGKVNKGTSHFGASVVASMNWIVDKVAVSGSPKRPTASADFDSLAYSIPMSPVAGIATKLYSCLKRALPLVTVADDVPSNTDAVQQAYRALSRILEDGDEKKYAVQLAIPSPADGLVALQLCDNVSAMVGQIARLNLAGPKTYIKPAYTKPVYAEIEAKWETLTDRREVDSLLVPDAEGTLFGVFVVDGQTGRWRLADPEKIADPGKLLRRVDGYLNAMAQIDNDTFDAILEEHLKPNLRAYLVDYYPSPDKAGDDVATRGLDGATIVVAPYLAKIYEAAFRRDVKTKDADDVVTVKSVRNETPKQAKASVIAKIQALGKWKYNPPKPVKPKKAPTPSVKSRRFTFTDE